MRRSARRLCWTAGIVPRTIGAREVEIWRCRLDDPRSDSVLSDEELARARSMSDVKVRVSRRLVLQLTSL